MSHISHRPMKNSLFQTLVQNFDNFFTLYFLFINLLLFFERLKNEITFSKKTFFLSSVKSIFFVSLLDQSWNLKKKEKEKKLFIVLQANKNKVFHFTIDDDSQIKEQSYFSISKFMEQSSNWSSSTLFDSDKFWSDNVWYLVTFSYS